MEEPETPAPKNVTITCTTGETVQMTVFGDHDPEEEVRKWQELQDNMHPGFPRLTMQSWAVTA